MLRDRMDHVPSQLMSLGEIGVELTDDSARRISCAANSDAPVSGLTHGFYRYPARFSPLLVRALVEAFTEPGDLVLDPFMGGGTTLVEATALGRRAAGCDVSSLAVFVSRVKTTLLDRNDVQTLEDWLDRLPPKLKLSMPAARDAKWSEEGYQRNIDGKETWRIRKVLELAVAAISDLPRSRQQRFARCALLKTGQWALDCRKQIPTIQLFRDQLYMNVHSMVAAVQEYAVEVTANTPRGIHAPFSLCLHRSAIGLESEACLRDSAPRLIVTSPPYPGVHVLYHRWQVRGRKETPAPFWLASSLDGSGPSYYTFGGRRDANLGKYYRTVEECFRSISQIVDRDTMIVQVIAFPEAWQVDEYLGVMEQAGFKEMRRMFPDLSSNDDRLCRIVPHRKWYADQRGSLGSAREVIFLHQLS